MLNVKVQELFLKGCSKVELYSSCFFLRMTHQIYLFLSPCINQHSPLNVGHHDTIVASQWRANCQRFDVLHVAGIKLKRVSFITPGSHILWCNDGSAGWRERQIWLDGGRGSWGPFRGRNISVEIRCHTSTPCMFHITAHNWPHLHTEDTHQFFAPRSNIAQSEEDTSLRTSPYCLSWLFTTKC